MKSESYFKCQNLLFIIFKNCVLIITLLENNKEKLLYRMF